MSLLLRLIIAALIFGTIWLGVHAVEADSPEDLAVKSRRLFDMINEERVKAGAYTLMWDDDIAGDARSHSEFMARSDIYEHSGAEYAECIMASCDPGEVFEAWNNSDPHQFIMLGRGYVRGGAGMGLVLKQYKIGSWTITYDSSRGFSTLMLER